MKLEVLRVIKSHGHNLHFFTGYFLGKMQTFLIFLIHLLGYNFKFFYFEKFMVRIFDNYMAKFTVIIFERAILSKHLVFTEPTVPHNIHLVLRILIHQDNFSAFLRTDTWSQGIAKNESFINVTKLQRPSSAS